MTNNLDITHVFGWQLDKGKIRENNQDSLGAAKIKLVSEDVQRSIGIYMVADGIGGMAEGGEASKIAIQTAMQEMTTHINQQDDPDEIANWLQSAANMAHRAIQLQQSKKDSQGTTLVMAAVLSDTAYFINIGDSRAYLLRDNNLRQITKDHTIAEVFVDQGIIEPEEKLDHPYSHVLSQAVGVEDISGDIFVEGVLDGDYLILCSDGLYGFVDDNTIINIISTAESPQDASDQLMQKANQAGGKDNIAVIVIKIHERQ
ncbi:MAG: protein phosphatase 2C domain-containing protein [Chloroflexota bacterium]